MFPARDGQPVAAVMDLSGDDRASVPLANGPRFLTLIEESRRSYRETGGIPIDDLRRELGLEPLAHALDSDEAGSS